MFLFLQGGGIPRFVTPDTSAKQSNCTSRSRTMFTPLSNPKWSEELAARAGRKEGEMNSNSLFRRPEVASPMQPSGGDKRGRGREREVGGVPGLMLFELETLPLGFLLAEFSVPTPRDKEETQAPVPSSGGCDVFPALAVQSCSCDGVPCGNTAGYANGVAFQKSSSRNETPPGTQA
ncbi:unnamed protein product [Cyprideis torosa]|uniref:Uncharacterized protein n=1 Tax=Cyprideis torosa TaxID=163714 RepID=A0A7R8ZGI0_9CRUS|nr:unnamed protein product [Cyprideis torosa]CAG0880096.1 unnamed protein product [Cyprideis torosa]